MLHNNTAANFDNAYQYKYNGKELQETGMYDYGARFYMPDIGRWGVMDPLAEVTSHLSPYHYGNNNPLMYNDPTGMLSQSFIDQLQNSPHGTTWYNIGQLNMLRLSTENSPSNKEITPWQLGVEWLSGKCPRHRDFTNGDLMTEMLRKQSHVQKTRDIILSKMALGQRRLVGSNSYKLGGIKGVGLYLKDYSTLLTGGLTGNLAVTYLRSYNLEYIAAAYNNTVVVLFSVENSSTMQSASRPPILGYLPIWQQTAGKRINEKFKTGWGSKTTQSFNWTETLYIK